MKVWKAGEFKEQKGETAMAGSSEPEGAGPARELDGTITYELGRNWKFIPRATEVKHVNPATDCIQFPSSRKRVMSIKHTEHLNQTHANTHHAGVHSGQRGS